MGQKIESKLTKSGQWFHIFSDGKNFSIFQGSETNIRLAGVDARPVARSKSLAYITKKFRALR